MALCSEEQQKFLKKPSGLVKQPQNHMNSTVFPYKFLANPQAPATLLRLRTPQLPQRPKAVGRRSSFSHMRQSWHRETKGPKKLSHSESSSPTKCTCATHLPCSPGSPPAWISRPRSERLQNAPPVHRTTSAKVTNVTHENFSCRHIHWTFMLSWTFPRALKGNFR